MADANAIPSTFVRRDPYFCFWLFPGLLDPANGLLPFLLEVCEDRVDDDEPLFLPRIVGVSLMVDAGVPVHFNDLVNDPSVAGRRDSDPFARGEPFPPRRMHLLAVSLIHVPTSHSLLILQ